MFCLDKLLLETVINNNNITDMYIIVCACNQCVTVVEAIKVSEIYNNTKSRKDCSADFT